MRKHKHISFLFVCLLLISSIYISGKHIQRKPDDAPDSLPPQTVTFKVNDFSYTLDLMSNGNFMSVGTLNSDRFNTISIGEYNGYDIKINGSPLPSGSEIELVIDSLAPDNKLTVSILEKATGEQRFCYINTLPDNYCNPPIITNNPDDGYYYFNLNEYVYKMDTHGNIVFWRLAGHGDISCGGDDFKMTEIDGNKYYSFLYGWETPDSPFLQGVGYGRMQGLVLDENYKIIDNVQFLELSSGEKVPLENHQFTVLGKNHYLLTAYFGKRVNNIPLEVDSEIHSSRVVANIIQEVKDGNIIFEWDSTNYPELYTLSSAGNDFSNVSGFWADYAHLNSVVIDSDQNFICSFRNLDTVLKIDRETGNILWKLGGISDDFGLTAEQKFSKQHDARITSDGYITIFNNGNEGNSFVSGNTTIIKVKLDEQTKSIIDFQEYTAQGHFSSHMGSAQQTGPSRFVIGWGGRATCSPIFSEIDFATGEVLFEVLSPKNSGDFPDIYKAYKFAE